MKGQNPLRRLGGLRGFHPLVPLIQAIEKPIAWPFFIVVCDGKQNQLTYG